MEESGSAVGLPENPFDLLLARTNNDCDKIQDAYEIHRLNRNAQQKARLLATEFAGLEVDPILSQMLADPIHYVDPRNSLVVWARPPPAVKDAVRHAQNALREVIPDLWLMAPDDLHITVLEIAHSLPAHTIDELVSVVGEAAPGLVAPPTGPAHLTRPQLSIDSAAVAMTFLPTNAGSTPHSYHHVRREVWARARDAGLTVASRYVAPSAHVTIARFVTPTADVPITRWVQALEDANGWLARECAGVDWVVAEDQGLILRKGRVWYGGGETVVQGQNVLLP